MTEADWLVCTDPGPMLEYLRPKASDRKLRLFACACLHRVWNRLLESERKAVEMSEQYANSFVTAEEWASAWDACEPRMEGQNHVARMIWRAGRPPIAQTALEEANWATAAAASLAVETLEQTAWDAFLVVETALLRELFGNPFRTVIDTGWLTSNVVAIAQRIYDDRNFTDLPILADALEDAGCDNAEILNHCRQPGVHVRGCWVVDLVLGKE
jgi:hypothetical protein